MNWTRIFWRMSWPALLAIALGLACDLALGSFLHRLTGGQADATANSFGALCTMAGLAVSAVWIAAAAWRLRRWETGRGPYCGHCSGPVGFRQDGKIFYGKLLADFRRCYNCGLVTSEPN